MANNKFCIECGYELPITAKFCESCGIELPGNESPSESNNTMSLTLNHIAYRDTVIFPNQKQLDF